MNFIAEDGTYWLYTGKPIANGMYVVVARERPTTPLPQVFADDIFMPLFQAGIAASLLSLLLAGAISNWIASPLQRIAEAAREFADGKLPDLTPEGPEEVVELGEAFIEMSERVFASQQSQRDFVANVSHELKTPLTSIQGFAQAMLDGTADDPATREQSSQIIYDEAGRMHRMVVELLDLARIDAGTAEFLQDPVDLNPLIHNVISKFQPQTEAAQVELYSEISSLPPLVGDGDRLSQVFTNLIDNALKHTPAGGRVIIRAQRVGDALEITVADTGKGIDPIEVERIFERFYQVDKARTGGAGRGIGLGLAIANEIVEKHGGTLSVQSQPGQGSTFTVRLPVANPA
jgi:signal transduction histidine kinase